MLQLANQPLASVAGLEQSATNYRAPWCSICQKHLLLLLLSWWRVLLCVLPVADNPEFKRRIAVALGLLVTSKLLTIQVGRVCVYG